MRRPAAVCAICAIVLGLGLLEAQAAREGITIPGDALTPASRMLLPLVLTGGTTDTDGQPSAGAPIAISPLDGTVWVVNPDAGSLTVVDPTLLTPIAELQVGQEPWSLVFSPDRRRVYVVDRAAGLLAVVDAARRTLVAHVAVGPEPGSVALSPSGKIAYVTGTSSSEVVVVDTEQLAVTARIAVGSLPYALTVSDDGDADDGDEHIFVTHLLAFQRPGAAEATDDGREGRVTVLDTATHSIVREIVLKPDSHGFPNMLAGIILAGDRGWVPHIRAAPALPNGLTTTTFAAVAALDTARGAEEPAASLLLNDDQVFGSPVNNPIALAAAPDRKTLYIVLAGSDLVEVVDVASPEQPRLVKFLATGKNPRGIAISPDGRRGFVMNYLSRSVTVLDLDSLVVLAEVTATGETLDPQVLRGKILFNSATDPRMARSSWTSCASCHVDGGADGVTWIFPDGPRQTPPLWSGTRTLPWHWSAALDEAQDVEDTIHTIQRGLGLATGMDPPLLGSPNAGRSTDLDALAAFLERGIRTPAAPAVAKAAIEPGRSVFIDAGCALCHNGPEWTVSARPGPAGTLDPDGNGMVDTMLRDVGSYNPADLRGRTGFDVPSLLGVGLTAPYLHDGSMATLEQLIGSGHPAPSSQRTSLTVANIEALVAFLRVIGPDTQPVAPP